MKAGKTKVSLTPVAEKRITITAPNFKTAIFEIAGNAPLVMHKFSQKAREQIMATQKAGKAAKSKKERKPKDFEAAYQGARHVSTEGWDGIPSTAIKAALVGACRLVEYKMTIAKVALFVESDGIESDGTALIRVNGAPHKHEGYGRNSNGQPDIRIRPMWNKWSAAVRIRFDADLFSVEDVSNLLMRAGLQIGILEGRPSSPNSVGCGWGTFDVVRGR